MIPENISVKKGLASERYKLPWIWTIIITWQIVICKFGKSEFRKKNDESTTM